MNFSSWILCILHHGRLTLRFKLFSILIDLFWLIDTRCCYAAITTILSLSLCCHLLSVGLPHHQHLLLLLHLLELLLLIESGVLILADRRTIQLASMLTKAIILLLQVQLMLHLLTVLLKIVIVLFSFTIKLIMNSVHHKPILDAQDLVIHVFHVDCLLPILILVAHW